MSDHSDEGHDHGDGEDGAHLADHGGTREQEAGRVTSPMQRYDSGQVTVGIVVLVIGLAVVFGVPLLL